MRESSKAVHPFRVAVKRAAMGPDGRVMAQFTGAVLVGIVFEFKRAKSNTDDYPTGKNIGDIDKLTRAVLDGLTDAKVIEDDSFVVGWLGTGEPSKIWGPEDRVIITVRKAPPPLSTLVQDFAEQVGRPLAQWQRVVLDEIVRPARNPFDHPSGKLDHLLACYDAACPGCYKAPTVQPVRVSCCNTVDHKSCLMMGAANCPCPDHCPA